MLKQLFLLSETEFIYSALSSALEEQSVHLFHLPHQEDWEYYFQDMKPQAVLVDFEGLSSAVDIKTKISSIKEPVYVLVEGENVDQALTSLGEYSGFIEKPINPFELKAILSTKLGLNH